ncbi:MAG TPA: histidine kinase [Puia sp.]|nr:histidine kinase [Puia sp.]
MNDKVHPYYSRQLLLVPKFIISLLCVAIYSSSLFSQEYNYVHYDVKDGLAGSTVYSMVQDKDGFMWFATETGLSRFDGTHFRNFYTSDGLPDNEIINLFVDSKNRVWIVPFKNSICYYWKGKIYNQENDSVLKQLQFNEVIIALFEDSFNNIFIADRRHVYLISKEQKISFIKSANNRAFSLIKAGIDNKKKIKILLTYNGDAVYKYAEIKQNRLFSNINAKPIKFGSEIDNDIATIAILPKLDVYKIDTLFHFIYPDNDSSMTFRFPPGFINLSSIDDTLITLNTYNGTYLFNLNQKKITDSFLTKNIINSVAKDNEGNLWFSSFGKGIMRLSSGRFIDFLSTPKKQAVFSILKSGSEIYAGSDGFIITRIDIKTKRIIEKKIFNGFTRGRITALTEKNNNIIAGTDIGLFALSPDDLSLRYNNFKTSSIKSISDESEKSILISCVGGAYIISSEKANIEDKVFGDRATCAYSQHKDFYIGTLNGLYSIDSLKKMNYLGNSFQAFKNRINAISSKSPDAIIWVATNGGGVVAYKGKKAILNITEKDGLTSNICRTIFISNNSIWVGTDKGLNEILLSPNGYKITSFTSSDGLVSDIINAVYVDSNDVYVGTPEGLSYFDENQISKKSICKLIMTEIDASGHQLPFDTTDFTLSHKSNNIEFHFVGISFKSAGKISYHYRLIGFDTSWKTTNLTQVSYTSLPSGDYKFQLIATNKFGLQSNPIKIPFTISKTLWEKTWFRIILVVVSAFILWFTINNRISAIRKKENEKSETIKRMSELEQMALKSQMNPHFIFNCLNSIQHYVINKDILGANEFISNFSKLVRLTLDNSSKTNINLAEEINYLTAYLELEQKRFEGKFDFKIVTDDIFLNSYFIPPMMLQPYIENAIRHGVRYRNDNKGRIEINFKKNDKYLICSISDNGIGRKLSQQLKSKNAIEYQSKGMDLTARRINMLNKTQVSKIIVDVEDLETGNGNIGGTRVTIQFPLSETAKENSEI